MKTYSLYIILVIWILIPKCHAQKATIVFDMIDEEDGLPTERVSDIFEDSDGVFWFGSFDGLTKYDGFRFELLRSNFSDPFSISGNNIHTIAEDLTHRLWIGTFNTGLNVSDVTKTRFQPISNLLTVDSEVPSSTIYDIAVDHMNRIWVAGDLGLQVFVSDADSFRIIEIDSLHAIDMEVIDCMIPQVMHIDTKHRIWLGCKNGLCFIDLNTGTIRTPSNDKTLPSEEIDDITVDRNQRVWFSKKSTESRLMYYDEKQETFTPFTEIPFVSAHRRLHFRIDKDNQIWAAVFGEQLYGYNLTDSTLFLISNENSNIRQERFIRRPFVDSYGNIWIPGEGIYKHDYSRGFNNYIHPFDFIQAITVIFREDSSLWIGYREAGLIRINLENQKIQRYHTAAPTPYRIPTNLIQGIRRLTNGKLAITGFSNFILLDEAHGVERTVRLNGSTKAVFEDSRQNVWVGGFNGLLKFNRQGDSIATYTLPPLNNERRNFIKNMAEDKEGNIWFASTGLGLSKLNPETEEVTRYLPHQDKNALTTTFLFDILLAGDSLWIGSDQGLFNLDLKSEKFTPIPLGIDSMNDHICAILKEEDQLWISTLRGVAKLDIQSGVVSRYDRTDGLLNNVYYDVAKSQHEGFIYFGGRHGLDYFSSDHIRDKYTDLTPKLSKFTVNNSYNISVDRLLSPTPIRLDYRSDLVEIQFGATRFLTDEDVYYAYHVDGLTYDYIPIEDQRRLVFTDLSPGKYNVQLKARSKTANWSPNTLQFTFEITPPLWQRIWFQCLCIAGFLSLIYFMIQHREQRIKIKEKKASEIKQRILKLEKMAVLAQMNPHFIFNSLNAIQQFIATGDSAGALKYVSKFGRLIRLVINQSAKELVTVREDAALIENYLEVESMRYPNRFSYQMHVADELIESEIYIPPFLVQPHIEQATRNSLLNSHQPGHIKISMSRANDHVRLLIEDNGCEVAESTTADNSDPLNGTSIVEQRLKYINQKLGNQKIKKEAIVNFDNEKIGTRVELLITISPVTNQ